MIKNTDSDELSLFGKSMLVACVLLLVIMCIKVIINYMSIPIVAISGSTGECTYVDNGHKKSGCENLPKKYNKVYVK